ncbi:MAG: DegT/DnrJ/EryC1/StrS family aminotransferase [Anaerolineae bacterium]|nr:DegT/DnrJ/EryC1/StrS family aminotransferase [Anaerolineae bacterium]
MKQKLAIEGGTPVRDTFLVFGAPCLGEEEIQEVVVTLRSGWIGTGPKTQQFEQAFAEYVGAPYALAVSSCTAALHLSLLAKGVGPGDEVITTPLTFAATANVIVHCGARPVFVDIQPDTLNINPELIPAAVSPRTKAIIPVHFGGLPVELNAVRAAVGDIPIIEDAAHAIGSRYQGQRIGAHGNLTCFSFYANKNLTTAEGGIITFSEGNLYNRLMVLRLHGLDVDAWKRYQKKGIAHSELLEAGYKYNLTDLQASLGLHQLAKVEAFLARRETIARFYDRSFADLPGVTRQWRPDNIQKHRHGLHLYVLIFDPVQFAASRDEIVTALRAENIGAGVHYTALHQETFYRHLLQLSDGAYPMAEHIGANVLSLPLTPGMTDQDAQDVVDATYKVLEAYRR